MGQEIHPPGPTAVHEFAREEGRCAMKTQTLLLKQARALRNGLAEVLLSDPLNFGVWKAHNKLERVINLLNTEWSKPARGGAR